jgi:glycosyltransferase involved in cell wall biosynthesis
MSGRRPGLLFIVNSLDVGGAEKQVVTLLNRLDTTRFRLHLAYLKQGAAFLPLLQAGRLDEVVCCHVTGGVERSAVRRLRDLIATRSIDVIVCTNTYSMLYGALAQSGGQTRPRLVTVFHTTLLRSYKEKLLLLLWRLLFRRCDLLIYVCENQRRYWRKRGLKPRADAVVHNGIDVDRFTDRYSPDQKLELRRSLGLADGDYVVGLCAALRPEKAHGDLLKAVARLRRQGVPAKALLIGDGPERALIEKMTVDLGLQQHVHITGVQQDVRPYIACCDVMTLVSRSIETFSLAALESMALGKPLVMSDIGGASEQVIYGQNGFLFEPADVDALAMHLSSLTSAPLRAQMGRAAAQRVRDLFTVDAMTNNFMERMQELIGSGELQRPEWLSHYGRGDRRADDGSAGTT